MAKEPKFNPLRQRVAQVAAQMMAEEGVGDYAYAKKKAARQLGMTENSAMPTNLEIEEELRLYHSLYSEDQPEALLQLRQDALFTMRLLSKFRPHLTGSVLDGTAGKHSDTHIHLFADSAKEVEIFLLNQQIPYTLDEKSFRVSDKRSTDRLRVPMIVLEGPNGRIKLSIFDYDDLRVATKHVANGENASKLDVIGLEALIAQSK